MKYLKVKCDKRFTVHMITNGNIQTKLLPTYAEQGKNVLTKAYILDSLNHLKRASFNLGKVRVKTTS